MSVRVEHGDCLEVLPRLAAEGVMFDSVVTDPPYHLTANKKGGSGVASINLESPYGRARIGTGNGAGGFMGKTWDGGDVAFRPETWAEVFRVMKPGAHLFAFSGTRTYHRMVCAIEDAGFEIRDQFAWVYGSGFPKSHDVSKAIDRAAGAERGKVRTPHAGNKYAKGLGDPRPWMTDAAERGHHEHDGPIPATAAAAWAGWGTAAKPAWEPIVLARKPLIGTVAANVLAHGTGAINIDASRVQYASPDDQAAAAAAAAAEQRSRQVAGRSYEGWGMEQQKLTAADYIGGAAGKGRWPANIIHDGSEEVLRHFPDSDVGSGSGSGSGSGGWWSPSTGKHAGPMYGDGLGSAARFFYTAKADAEDRLGSKHPTVKPVDLIAYLCRLITPPGGLILDPFAGSGTTGMACLREGFRCVLIEREEEYYRDILKRIDHVRGADTPLFASVS